MKEDVKAWIDIYRYLYDHKGTVGTIVVALEIWYEFGFLSSISFVGIVLMICGGIATIAKGMND